MLYVMSELIKKNSTGQQHLLAFLLAFIDQTSYISRDFDFFDFTQDFDSISSNVLWNKLKKIQPFVSDTEIIF